MASIAASKAASRAVSRAPSLRLSLHNEDPESGLGATAIPFSAAPTVAGSVREDTGGGGDGVHTYEEVVESVGKGV